MRSKSQNKAFIFFFLMSLIFLDFGNQLRNISYKISLNNPVFSITHTFNTGFAFGIFKNHSMFLGIFALFCIALLSFYVYKKITFENKIELLAITLLVSGALGNSIERFRFNHVVDYIKLNFVDFAVFNAFDVMICIGVLIYIFKGIKDGI